MLGAYPKGMGCVLVCSIPRAMRQWAWRTVISLVLWLKARAHWTGCWEIRAVRAPHGGLLFLMKAQFLGEMASLGEGHNGFLEGLGVM